MFINILLVRSGEVRPSLVNTCAISREKALILRFYRQKLLLSFQYMYRDAVCIPVQLTIDDESVTYREYAYQAILVCDESVPTQFCQVWIASDGLIHYERHAAQFDWNSSTKSIEEKKNVLFYVRRTHAARYARSQYCTWSNIGTRTLEIIILLQKTVQFGRGVSFRIKGNISQNPSL